MSGATWATPLSPTLPSNSDPTFRSLDWSGLGVEGGWIAEILLSNPTLTYLDISANKIKVEGISRITEALSINSSLATLDLGDNNLKAEGAALIAKALANNSTL